MCVTSLEQSPNNQLFGHKDTNSTRLDPLFGDYEHTNSTRFDNQLLKGCKENTTCLDKRHSQQSLDDLYTNFHKDESLLFPNDLLVHKCPDGSFGACGGG